jgi:hypothetical protein
MSRIGSRIAGFCEYTSFYSYHIIKKRCHFQRTGVGLCAGGEEKLSLPCACSFKMTLFFNKKGCVHRVVSRGEANLPAFPLHQPFAQSLAQT